MKILKLRYKNINSLKGEGEIDFTNFLDGSSLFAITGDTGSGKTTLLDIITCALYAKTPRLGDKVKELLRRGSSEALCEVEFEVNNKAYRSSWNLTRARGKTDGNFQPTKMELYTLEGKSIISGVRKVPKKIEEIIGLDFERFTKSMMLSQGAFDAFLKANDSERSELLEKITGITIYSEISKMVHKKAKAKEEELKLKEAEIKAIQPLSQEVVNNLNNELRDNKRKKEELEKRLESLKYEKEFLELERELASKEEELKEAKGKEAENSHLFIQLDRANRALSLYPLYNLKSELTNSLNSIEQEIDRLIKEENRLNREKESIEREQLETKDRLSSFGYSYDKLIDISISFKRLIEDLKDTEDRLSRVEDELNSTIKERDKALKKSNLSKDDLKALEEELKEVNSSYGSIDAKEQYLQELKRYYETVRNIKERSRVLESLKEEQKSLLSKKDELKRVIEDKRELLDTLKSLRERELLIKKYEADRKRLKEGEPCFLCGSTNHPYIKEHIDVDSSATSTKISNIEDELNRLREDLSELEKNLSLNITNQERISSEIKELKESIEENLDIDTQDIKELEQEIETIILELSNLRDLRLKERLKRQIDDYDRDIDSKAREQKEYKGLIRDIQDKLEGCLLEFKIDTKDYKEALEILDSKKEDYKSIQERLRELESSYKIATESIKDKKESIKRAKEEYKLKKERLTKVARDFNNRLIEIGFKDENEFLASYLEDSKKRELEDTIESIRTALIEAKTKIKDIKEKLKGYKDIESSNSLDEIDKEIANIKRNHQELLEAIGGINSTLKRDKEDRDRYDKELKVIDELKKEFDIIDRLDKLIGSENGKKFSKFAQDITLKYLITLANRHLKLLSDRYLIAKESGKLEIVIVDKYQANERRPSNTLSGGESFLISLSLALGLSELASQRVSIDSLFLDEGFGTLDSNTLDIALDALSKLESRGKMVGIISHIDSVKERIPLQIRVDKIGGGESRIELIKR